MPTPIRTWPPTITSTTDPIDTNELRTWLREEHWANEVQRTLVIGLLAKIDALQAPVEMIMFCPMCSTRHIDRALADKPHKEHACQGCGFVWKPSRRHTVGVAYLPDYKDPEPQDAVIAWKEAVWSSIPGPLELLERAKVRAAARAELYLKSAPRTRDVGPHQPAIKDTGPAQPEVSPTDVGRAIGADGYLSDPSIDVTFFTAGKCPRGPSHKVVTQQVVTQHSLEAIEGGGGWALTCSLCKIVGFRRYQSQDHALQIAGLISSFLGKIEALTRPEPT